MCLFKNAHSILTLLLLTGYALAATVPPPPSNQMVPDLAPEFVPLEAATTTTQKSAKANDDIESEDAEYWNSVARKQLEKNVKLAKQIHDTAYQHKAKNIIIFVGDGMGVTTITAGRIYKGQYLKRNHGEEETLAFDEFPFTGMSKTYNVDKQVPDSAGTATAMFCGVKTFYGAIGLDITRSKTDGTKGRLQSIMDWAQAEGKRTGVVTTTRITHATPAATYARVYHRDWECDTEVPQESVGKHQDIARQLVENAPGNKFNVIMGGGLSPMGALNTQESVSGFEGSTEKVCKRGDNRNLTQEWLQLGNGKESRVFVQTREQLQKVDTKDVDHLMGLFRNNHITFAIKQQEGEPTLKEMTEAAIGVLERGTNSNGFVLLVEGGRIDQGHHQNYARAALHEVYEFDAAIQAAVELTNSEETLIIVTADHSHAVTLNGYPARGTDILGFANKESEMVYETITYANGPGYYDHLANDSTSNRVWRPLEQFTAAERASPFYRHVATMPLKDESHGGEDVVVFASGPGASLVRGVFEQNFIAYIMSYAGCMGPAKNFDDTCKVVKSSAAALRGAPIVLAPLLSLLYILIKF